MANVTTMRTLRRLCFGVPLMLCAPSLLSADLFTGSYMSAGSDNAAGTRKPGQIQVVISEKEHGKFYRVTFFEGYKEPRTVRDVYECPYPNSFHLAGEEWRENNTAALCHTGNRAVFFFSERGKPMGMPIGSRIDRSNYFAPTGFRTTAFTRVSHPVPTSSLEDLAAVDRAEWMEEVQLVDGAIVVIKRISVRDIQGTPVSRRGAVRRWELVFPDGTTRWRSDGSASPLSIETLQGIPYIAVKIHSRDLCAKYGDPEGSLVFFRWSGSWGRIARTEYPDGGRVNLLSWPWGRTSQEDMKGLIKNDEKRLKPGNKLGQTPINELLANRAQDSCFLYKRN